AKVPSFPVIVVFPSPELLTTSERELLAGEGNPSERAVRATGAETLADQDAVELATERLYRVEFLRGHMRADLLGGISVSKARESMTRQLLLQGTAFDLQEFSKPVICRNGHDVVIRRVPDQWFIRYSDPAWKSRTRDLVGRMAIFPDEYHRELPSILDWLGDRPCTRKGRWLGTPFPLDPGWVIEPIADSTFYPAYFVVRPFVAAGRLTPAQLTDAFFDFVFKGEGDGEPTVDAALQREVHEAFNYWYPLDVNIGGKEHKRVHFPVFLATHVLLLPPQHQPKGLFVHWWLTQPGGQKISKKHVGGKGGVIPPTHEALERWGADALRLFYATAASSAQDIEWSPSLVDHAQTRLEEIERQLRAVREDGASSPELEAWLSSEIHLALRTVAEGFARFELREVAEVAYVRFPALLRRFALRGGEGGPIVRSMRDAWTRLLVPITPHLAEELGEGRFGGLVSVQPFPTPDDFPYSEIAVERERFLDQVEEDLRQVLRPSQSRGENTEGVVFFVASPWKRLVESWVRDVQSSNVPGVPVREVMERSKAHPEVAASRSEIPKYVQRVAPLLRQEPLESRPIIDELSVLRSAEGYLVRRLGFRTVQVVPEEEGEPHDPLHRRERARPGRPAFFLIGSPKGFGKSPEAGPTSGPSGAGGGS
ncbi:MAG: class I tRNA ligase family protein, partial [Thermoplasmata archaeon]|nr:class I tRNA ligase family protein [Thermoplasmata archaeon]